MKDMSALTAWANFYVIVGSAAGALIGLQFVVLSLVAGRPGGVVNEQSGRAFSTPTIVHFCAVLTLAALFCAPWEGFDGPIAVCGLAGLAGLVYSAIVTRRILAQSVYRPEFEDWLFHIALPFVTYGVLIVCAVCAKPYLRPASFGVAGAVLMLLLIGIHNAWDGVTYHVFNSKRD
jgi:hypothetical protein